MIVRAILSGALVSVAVAAAAPAAVVVRFDELSTPFSGGGVSAWGLVPTHYYGLAWDGWEVTRADNSTYSYQQIYQNSYPLVSGPQNNIAYNGGNGNGQVAISDSVPFYFQGALVSSFSQRNAYQTWSSHAMTIQGYLGPTLVGTATIQLLPNAQTAIGPLHAAVDRLVVSSDGNGADGRYWTMDNFTFAHSPEPASIAIWGVAGLLFAIGASRRKATVPPLR